MACITVYGNIVKDAVEVQRSTFDGEPFFTRYIQLEDCSEEGLLLTWDHIEIRLGFDEGAAMYLAQWGLKPREAK